MLLTYILIWDVIVLKNFQVCTSVTFSYKNVKGGGGGGGRQYLLLSKQYAIDSIVFYFVFF